MSFWSKIGLADKKTVEELQSEISLLRAENKAYQEQNQKFLEGIKENSIQISNAMFKELSNMQKHVDEKIADASHDINEIRSAVAENNKSIEEISTQMSSYNDAGIKTLNDIQHMLSADTAEIKEALEKEIAGIRSDMVLKCDENMAHQKQSIEQITEQIANIDRDMNKVRDSVAENNKGIKEINIQMSSYNDAGTKMMDDIKTTICDTSETAEKLLEDETNNIRNSVISKLQKNTEILMAEKEVLVKQIEKTTEEIKQMLLTSENQLNETQEYIQDNNRLLNESKRPINETADISRSLLKKTADMEEMQESLVSLTESVKSLWSIMKAVWVDSILSDIDSVNNGN